MVYGSQTIGLLNIGLINTVLFPSPSSRRPFQFRVWKEKYGPSCNASRPSFTLIVTSVDGLLGEEALHSYFVLWRNSSSTRIKLHSDITPTFSKPRPVPSPILESVNAQLNDLEQRGIIRLVTSSRFASPLVWEKKKDGSLRMCADL